MKKLLFALLTWFAVTAFADPKLLRTVGLDGGLAAAPTLNATGTRAAMYWFTESGIYELRMYDLEKGALLWRQPVVRPKSMNFQLGPDDHSALAFSADGQAIYANIRQIDRTTVQPDHEFTLRAYRTEDGQESAPITNFPGPAHSMAVWSEDDAEMLAVSAGARVQILQTNMGSSRQWTYVNGQGSEPSFLAANLHAKGPYRLALVNRSGTVTLIGDAPRRLSTTFSLSEKPTAAPGIFAAAFIPDGPRLMVFGQSESRAFLQSVLLSAQLLRGGAIHDLTSFYEPTARRRREERGDEARRGAYGTPHLGGVAFAPMARMMILGKTDLLSKTCAQLISVGPSDAKPIFPIANPNAGEAAETSVAISANGSEAVLLRNFGFDPTQRGPVQLEVWKLFK